VSIKDAALPAGLKLLSGSLTASFAKVLRGWAAAPGGGRAGGGRRDRSVAHSARARRAGGGRQPISWAVQQAAQASCRQSSWRHAARLATCPQVEVGETASHSYVVLAEKGAKGYVLEPATVSYIAEIDTTDKQVRGAGPAGRGACQGQQLGGALAGGRLAPGLVRAGVLTWRLARPRPRPPPAGRHQQQVRHLRDDQQRASA
jgi:hypothetical protein